MDEEYDTISHPQKILRYVRASVDTVNVVKMMSFLMMVLCTAMIIFGIITRFLFDTISDVTFTFSIIISVILYVTSALAFRYAVRVSMYVDKLDNTRKNTVATFVACSIMVMCLAFLTGCYSCVLLVAMAVVSGMIVCLIWNWKILRPNADYEIIGQNGMFIDISKMRTDTENTAFNSVNSYKEPENPVFSIGEEVIEITGNPEPIKTTTDPETVQPTGIP